MEPFQVTERGPVHTRGKVWYHVSPSKNIKGILRHGLICPKRKYEPVTTLSSTLLGALEAGRTIFGETGIKTLGVFEVKPEHLVWHMGDPEYEAFCNKNISSDNIRLVGIYWPETGKLKKL